ncbi:site-specific integrase [Nocardia amamiensis]|uniref:Site-specific integrase n=1 Tax=Nocardia amamiensis TaxID=404578 RepID=A0ABS0D3D3_9NOCA|nr:site-specific integrase [Nocardia amamiensis]MBF6302930.1 site-specific integrase [Nocardia amamiensis]
MTMSASNVEVQTAQLLLERLGVTLEDLMAAQSKRLVPTFAEYVPIVYAAMPPGRTRDLYSSYWNRIVKLWPDRRLDEPTITEFKRLIATLQDQRDVRRSDRGGIGVVQTTTNALRCLYRHAVDDNLIRPADNPAAKLVKPRRRPSSRGAIPTDRLAEINRVAAEHGDDPELTTLILRFCTETACRRGGILALRKRDLDPDQCLVLLREKGNTERWQPVSPTLMRALLKHHDSRAHLRDEPNPQAQNGRPITAKANERLLRYRNGDPISTMRFNTIWNQIGQQLTWVKQQGITCHWLRHTTLTWVERNFGHAVAKAYAGHADNHTDGATLIYTRATREEVAYALSALTGEPHPLAPNSYLCTRRN